MHFINKIFNILFIVLFFVEIPSAFGQSEDILQLIEKENINRNNDSVAFQELYGKAWGKINENIEGVQIYIKALDFYIKKPNLSNNSFLVSNFNNFKGNYFYTIGKLDSAIICFEKSVVSLKRDSINLKGEVYSNDLPIFYNNLALIYDEIGFYNNAIDLQTKSIVELEERILVDKENKYFKIIYANEYVELAMMYSNMNDTVAAYNNFRKGLSLSVKYKNNEAIAYSQMNYAVFLLDIGELDSALYYFKKGEGYYVNSGDFYTFLLIKINQAKIAKEHGEFEKAKSILFNVINSADSVGFDRIRVDTYEVLINLFSENKDYKNAEKYANKYIELNNNNNGTKSFSNVLNNLALIYDSTNRPNLAFDCLQKAKDISDSIYESDNIMTSHLIQAKYDLDVLNSKNLYLSNQNTNLDKILTRLRLVSILAFALLIVVSTLAIFIYNSYDKKRKLNKEFIITNKLLEQRTQDLTNSNDVLEKIFSVVSHDLKGPIGNAGLLLEYIGDNSNTLTEAEKNDYIEMLIDSLKSTHVLLEDILNWSRNRVGKEMIMSEVDLHELVTSIFENLKSTIFTKNIRLINNVPKMSVINTDHDYMKTIIRNVVSNSIKFTKNEGAITIEFSENDGHQVITIADTGLGMTKEKVDSILNRNMFKPSIGTNEEQGTGMGLLISLDLAEKINANISIESELNKGTSFIIDFKGNKLS